jgi:type IV pilus assembly protein PilE
MKNNKGFSLLELLIVVSIIGILAGIAYPSYTNSLVKGSRGAAKAYLLEVAQKQQQFLLDNRAYGSETEIKALLAEPKEFTNFYTLTITNPAGNPPTFTAKATPKAGTRQAGDGWLQIDNTGSRTSQYENKW